MLWTAAGGRCEFEGCNKPLNFELLTKRNGNFSYIAHITADRADGPRGNSVDSPKLGDDINNLMLICGEHHHLIDDSNNLDIYTVEKLKDMKKKHEERIHYLTGLSEQRSSHVVCYSSKIGNHFYKPDFNEILSAMYPVYPAERPVIDVGFTGNAYNDDEECYWIYSKDQLDRNFETKVRRRIEIGEINNLSVFALAPQPLLIELGRLISDIVPSTIFQKHREPDSWAWQIRTEKLDYIIGKPDTIFDKVAINLSLSANINNQRIENILGEQVSVWTVTIPNPNNDFVRGQEDTQQFRKVMRFLFDEIKKIHSNSNCINIFPACPISLAIELGRVWMPKADLPLVLYDQNSKAGGFIHTFDIC